MQCFNHSDHSAVGLCKVCGKGLCHDCATDLGYGLACKDKHEAEAEGINLIISKNTKMYKSTGWNTLLAPSFLLFMGLVFAGYGYFSGGGASSFLIVIGVGFVIYAIANFIHRRAVWRKPES